MSLAQRAIRAASELLSRAQFARATGKTFEGLRELDVALGYKSTLSIQDYWARFDRGGIAGRIVEAYPKSTWREAFELIEDENVENETAFEKAWDELNERLHIQSTFFNADVLSGIGQYGIIFLGLTGKPETEAKTAGPDALKYLMTYSQKDVEIAEYETRPEDPRFGMPTMYTIKNLIPTESGSNTAQMQVRAHWTRVIHIREGTTDNTVFGRPRLKRPWNKLDDLDKIVGGGAEAAFLRANQGLQIDVDPEFEFDEAAEKALSDEVTEYQNKLRRTIRTRGATITPLGSDVHNFGPNAASVIDQIAAISEIPQRILMGSERGQLASEQDDENWKNRVKDRRTNYAGPMIVRQTIDRFIALGVLPAPKSYDVQWPEAVELTPKEQADIADKWAGLNKKAGGVVVLPEEIRDKTLGLEPLTPAQIAANKPEPEQPPPGNVPPRQARRSIARGAFNPDQERDDNGQWSSEGESDDDFESEKREREVIDSAQFAVGQTVMRQDHREDKGKIHTVESIGAKHDQVIYDLSDGTWEYEDQLMPVGKTNSKTF